MLKIRLAIKKLLVLLIPVFVLVTVSAVAAGENKQNRRVYRWSEKKYLHDILNSRKVSPIVRAVKENIEDRSITARSARGLNYSALSNPLVKVDEDGNIHTYIRVHSFGAAERTQLEAYDAEIETVNEEHGIVQAWIPFEVVDQVAQLTFVKLISPPGATVGRVCGASRVCQAEVSAERIRATASRSSAGVNSGLSRSVRRRTMSYSFSCSVRRVASVGCAVKTGWMRRSLICRATSSRPTPRRLSSPRM